MTTLAGKLTFFTFLVLLLTGKPMLLFSQEVQTDTTEKETDLQLESPELGAPSKEDKGIELGPVSNINFGGLFDLRYVGWQGQNKKWVAPRQMIHVDELVITANIGENIFILAEQLLPTSRFAGFDQIILDDHGFVYAVFSNIPFLRAVSSFRVGRFRTKYGIDAVLDAPSNPIYNNVRKNLGFISDRAFEISGFLGPIDYVLAIADGPDFVEMPVKDSFENMLGSLRMGIHNNSRPLVVRFSTSSDLSRTFRFGLSYFDGRSWPYRLAGTILETPMGMQHLAFRESADLSTVETLMEMEGHFAFGGSPDLSTLVYKQKRAIDAIYKLGRTEFQGEYSPGKERENWKNYTTQAYFLRVDHTIIPRKWTSLLQYDRFEDTRPGSLPENNISAASTHYLTDQAYIRIGYSYNLSREFFVKQMGFLQFYLPF